MKVRNTTGRQVLVDDQFVPSGLDFVEVKATTAIKRLVSAGVLEAAPDAPDDANRPKAESKKESA